MKENLGIRIAFGLLLAFAVNSFIYFGFGNIYSNKIFNYSYFYEQFHSGVYQYRILGPAILMWIYNFLGNFSIDYSLLKLKFYNSQSDPRMYLSFYLLNTIFAMLTAAVMALITENKHFFASSAEKIMIMSTSVFAIAFSQFVILPYDCISYFLLLLFFLFILKYIDQHTRILFSALIVLVIIATLNRESAALMISLAATLYWDKFKISRFSLFTIGIFTLAFLITYFGMRIATQSFTTNDGDLLALNFSQPKNILGLMMWAVFFCMSLLISKDRNTTSNILVFHLLSIPYLLMCFYGGILYEVRLYIPAFLGSIVFARIDLKKV